MRIIQITVKAGRTISNPNDQYSNSKPELTLTATIEGSDDIDKIALDLQEKAENSMDNLVDRWLEKTTGQKTPKQEQQVPGNNSSDPSSAGYGDGGQTNNNTKPATAKQIRAINYAVNRKNMSVQDRKSWVKCHIFDLYGVSAISDLSMKDAMDLFGKLIEKKK